MHSRQLELKNFKNVSSEVFESPESHPLKLAIVADDMVAPSHFLLLKL